MHHRTRRLSRHLRGLLVALTAIALSAGVALAARPSSAPPAAATPGLTRAADAAGKTVPVVVEAPAVPEEGTEAPDPSTADEDADAKDATETTDVQTDSRPQNHGWFVSQAAKADTPAGFDNHGAYVSSIAKSDQGKPAAPAAAAAGQAKAAAAKAAAATHQGGHGH